MSMADLIVLGFPDLGLADEAINEIERLQQEALIVVSEWVRVIRRDDGTIDLRHPNGTIGAGALRGSVLGLLAGLILRMPMGGAVIGGVTGAIVARHSDVGIDDAFVAGVGLQIAPGTSALVIYVVKATADRVIDRMRRLRPRVLRTSLSSEAEARLRRAVEGPSIS
jgi:uncharacterized membrane protein